MSERDVVHACLAEGRAEIRIGERTIEVDRRDHSDRAHTCPIELVSAALGS